MAAYAVSLGDPCRLWKWVEGVYKAAILWTRYVEQEGEEAAERLFREHPYVLRELEAVETDWLYRESTAQMRNDPETDMTRDCEIIVCAALNDELARGSIRSANAVHTAVARRLGQGITREVVRRVERKIFVPTLFISDDRRAALVMRALLHISDQMRETDRSSTSATVPNASHNRH